MELEISEKELVGDIEFKCKFLKREENKNDCVVCLMDNTEWLRYGLSCGHQMHRRCGRRYWYTTEGKILCPLCRDSIKYDKYYCRTCDTWERTRWDSQCKKYPNVYDSD